MLIQFNPCYLFLTNESSIEEGGSIVASVAVVQSSSTYETVSDTDSTDKAMYDTNTMGDSVTNSSHQSTVSNENRGDNIFFSTE